MGVTFPTASLLMPNLTVDWGGKPQASFLGHSWRENSGDRGTIPARIHWASFGQFTRYSCNFPLSHLPS